MLLWMATIHEPRTSRVVQLCFQYTFTEHGKCSIDVIISACQCKITYIVDQPDRIIDEYIIKFYPGKFGGEHNTIRRGKAAIPYPKPPSQRTHQRLVNEAASDFDEPSYGHHIISQIIISHGWLQLPGLLHTP